MDQRAIIRQFCPVVYEDEHCLFMNKPAGLSSQPREHSAEGSVIDLLAEREDAAALLPLYDIDKWQSGVLGFAKNEDIARHLLTGLQTQAVKLAYLAVVRGKVKTGPQVVTLGIKQVDRERFAVDRKAPGADQPTTRIEPMERGPERTMVRCKPGLLNPHQVRAHLQSIGLSVVGDRIYRTHPDKAQVGPLMLHLGELRFHHPVLKRSITVRADAPADYTEAVNPAPGKSRLNGTLAARLRAALASRLPCFADEGTDAFRILNGRADAVGGMVADLYGDVVVLQAHQGKFDAAETPPKLIARWYSRELGAAAVYLKQFAKDRSGAGSGPDELRDPQPLAGKPVAEAFTIRENGLNFVIRPYDGYSVGLFLDHRDNRRRIRELAAGRRMLNLFGYTCGFSVAAAAGGAESTVSVDISRKALEWGKENFQANDIALDQHTFINDDAFSYFKRAERQGRKFGLVVIDPPSFARSKKKGQQVFTLEKDLQHLVAKAMSLLEPGGIVLVSTNDRGASRKWLREQVMLAAGTRRVLVLDTPGLPLDFAGDRDYVKTMIVRVGGGEQR